MNEDLTAKIHAFCGLMGLHYKESTVKDGMSIYWFKDRNNHEVYYTKEEILSSLTTRRM